MLVCICRNSSVDIWRINIIVFGFIFLLLGIQGLINNIDKELPDEMKLFSIFIIFISSIFIIVGFIKTEDKEVNKEENKNLLDNEINQI